MKPAVRVRKVKHNEDAQLVLQRISDYIDSKDRGVSEVLRYFWKDQQDAVSYAELRTLVLNGYVSSDQVRLWQQDYVNLVNTQLNDVWGDSLTAGSLSQPIIENMGFKIVPMKAETSVWLKEHGAEFVTNVTEQQKEAISQLLQFEMMQNHSVDEMARMIRPCIGLTKGQTASAMKVYDNVRETLRKDHPRMKAESIERKALNAAQRYAEKAHRQRADTIAITEIAKAYNHGAHEAIRQLQRAGLVGVMKKVWCTASDQRVCPHCESLDGKTVGFDEGFDWGKYLFQDDEVLPPAHPLCRCAVMYVEADKSDMIGGLPEYLEEFEVNEDDVRDARATFHEIWDEMPNVMKVALNDTTVRYANDPSSHYDIVNDIITLTPGSTKEAVYHEIGHVFAEKVVDKAAAEALLKDIISEIPITELLSGPERFINDKNEEVWVDLIKSPRFVSEYQGRFYGKEDGYLDENGRFRTDRMLEFLSEPFREFYTNNARLYTEFYEFYELIARGLGL